MERLIRCIPDAQQRFGAVPRLESARRQRVRGPSPLLVSVDDVLPKVGAQGRRELHATVPRAGGHHLARVLAINARPIVARAAVAVGILARRPERCATVRRTRRTDAVARLGDVARSFSSQRGTGPFRFDLTRLTARLRRQCIRIHGVENGTRQRRERGAATSEHAAPETSWHPLPSQHGSELEQSIAPQSHASPGSSTPFPHSNEGSPEALVPTIQVVLPNKLLQHVEKTERVL